MLPCRLSTLGRAALRAVNSSSTGTCTNKGIATAATHNSFFQTLMDSDGKYRSHSSALATSPTVYEVLTESVEPGNWEDYLKHKADFFEAIKACPGVELDHLASWHFTYGDPDKFKCLHLIKFKNGWTDLDKTRLAMKKDAIWLDERNRGLKLIRQQGSELFNSFAYWPEPVKREGSNIYDVRTYHLKPGSMYDWARYWSKGIDYRKSVRSDIPYCGLFSQVGMQNQVNHIWVYKDLSDRKACRTGTWTNPEWNDVVANTVPLFTKLTTKIMEPLPFSPTQ